MAALDQVLEELAREEHRPELGWFLGPLLSAGQNRSTLLNTLIQLQWHELTGLYPPWDALMQANETRRGGLQKVLGSAWRVWIH